MKFSDGSFENQFMTFMALEGAWDMVSEEVCPNLTMSEALIYDNEEYAQNLFDETDRSLALVSDSVSEAIKEKDLKQLQSLVMLKMALSFLHVLCGSVIGHKWEMFGGKFVEESAHLIAEFEVTFPEMQKKMEM